KAARTATARRFWNGFIWIPSGVVLVAGLGGRNGTDGERMDFLLHHVADRVVDEAMAGDRVPALESGRHDVQAVVAAAVACTGMAGVQGGVVLNVDLERGGRRQAFADSLGHAHGNTFLNGRTMVRAKTPCLT